MDISKLQRRRFLRGPDRRTAGSNPQDDLRERLRDRRQNGPGWIPLFRDIDETTLLDKVKNCDVLTLPAGTLLLKPGDKNDCIYLLLSGELAAHFDKDFKPEAALPIKPGECIGEFSAIDGKPVSAFVLALKDARVLHVPPDAFWEELMPTPGVARNLLISLTERMRRSNEITLEAQRKQLALQYLKQELEVARQLQTSMLPHRPFFPDRQDIEIEGLMEPASEIGGDFFDTFFVDEHLLFFCVGDVSGHGIPAALFMARAIGLIRISAMTTNRPDHLLERINNQLCEGNDTNMFVTLLCGFLDIRSGRLLYSNAGHCAPIHLRDNQAKALPLPKGSLAGVIPGIHYQCHEFLLAAGDVLLCYTDGVTEAQTENGAEFSEKRLFTAAAEHAYLPLQDLLQTIRLMVADFTDHGALFDDCTLLALRRPQ